MRLFWQARSRKRLILRTIWQPCISRKTHSSEPAPDFINHLLNFLFPHKAAPPVARPHLRFQSRLSPAEIEERRLACQVAGSTRELKYWGIITRIANSTYPHPLAQIAGEVGVSLVTVRTVLNRWNAHGPGGLADKRKSNGRRCKLNESQRQRLASNLLNPPADGGEWTGKKVAAHVFLRWAITISPVTGWRLLNALREDKV